MGVKRASVGLPHMGVSSGHIEEAHLSTLTVDFLTAQGVSD